MIPDPCQRMEDTREIPAFVGREQARDIFPHNETRTEFGDDADEFIKKT